MELGPGALPDFKSWRTKVNSLYEKQGCELELKLELEELGNFDRTRTRTRTRKLKIFELELEKIL